MASLDYFDYSDVRLIPKKGIVSSRKFCTTYVDFGKYNFSCPVVPANMKSVVDEDTCVYLATHSWFYIYHRFHENYVEDTVKFCKKMKKLLLPVSISVGVNEIENKALAIVLKAKSIVPDYITIDIAHGHCKRMIETIKFFKNNFPKTFIIAGNVCTNEGVYDLEKAGADAIKVGVGGGSPCSTYNKTGFGDKGFALSNLQDICVHAKVPIIADGGIKEHGDIAKAISAGATMVMAGQMFAGYDESAGEVVVVDDNKYKVYYGSASLENKNENKNIEGRKMLVSYKGGMLNLLKSLIEDLQSSISYSGGNDLFSLRNVKWVVIE